MPPFEGFDPINLRQASSLYDNFVDEVNTYSSGLTRRFHISIHSNRQDVVATRDIIVGKHPLCEPGTPEWDEYVLGKQQGNTTTNQEQKQQEPRPRESPRVRSPDAASSRSSKKHRKQPGSARSQGGRRGTSNSTSGCENPSDAMEWLEMFTTMCLAPKARRTSCAGWTTDDIFEPYEEEMKTPEVHRKPSSVHSDDDSNRSLPKFPATQQKNRVLYPIAKYPSRLDSQRLVAQRRKFLENQINFKPLRLDTRKPRKPKKF